MGPINLCYVTRHFPCVPMSLFRRPWRHFLYSFYKISRRISTTFKVAMSQFVFFYPRGALEVIGNFIKVL